MNFKFHLGTRVFFGAGCLGQNKELLGAYGKKAFIVTGPLSARRSGALEDVIKLLEGLDVQYYIYDKIENNPSLENVQDAGLEARAFSPDFIIGIGGGSPLDASKATAVLAVNAVNPEELYRNEFENRPLPVIAIPTTAGTGSEVTPYCILTRKDLQTKMSFGNEHTFPVLAFLDARYTASMSREITVNTAVDAFSHALEGYISKRSTQASDLLAEGAIGIFGQCVPFLEDGLPGPEIREKLLYMSMLGGMVIAQTGTTIVHGMGYSLTYFKGIPHGRANGYLLKEYLGFNYKFVPDKINRVLQLLGVSDIGEFGALMDRLLKEMLYLGHDDIELYSELTMQQRSTGYNIRPVTQKDVADIFTASVKQNPGKGLTRDSNP